MEGRSKCVVQMTMEFEGIPYGDCFTVEIRWVARATDASVVTIDVGAAVVFRKQTFLKSKISSGTIEESRPTHESLFRAVRSALSSGDVEVQPGAPNSNAVPTIHSPEPLAKVSSWFCGLDIETRGMLGLFLLVIIIVYRSSGMEARSYQCSQKENDLNQQLALVRTELLELNKSLKEVKGLLHVQVLSRTRED